MKRDAVAGLLTLAIGFGGIVATLCMPIPHEVQFGAIGVVGVIEIALVRR